MTRCRCAVLCVVGRYREQWSFFEAVIMLKKGLLVVVSTLLAGSGHSHEVYAGIFVMATFLALQMMAQPHRVALQHRLEVASQTVTIITLCTLCWLHRASMPGCRMPCTRLFMLVHSCVALCCAAGWWSTDFGLLFTLGGVSEGVVYIIIIATFVLNLSLGLVFAYVIGGETCRMARSLGARVRRLATPRESKGATQPPATAVKAEAPVSLPPPIPPRRRSGRRRSSRIRMARSAPRMPQQEVEMTENPLSV